MLRLPHSRPGGLIAARFDGLTLLFDRLEISAVEKAERVTQYSVAIYTLSRMLEPVTGVVRPFFVIVRHSGGEYGLTCDEVLGLHRTNVDFRAVPSLLQTDHSPFKEYIRLREGVGFLCAADALYARLIELEPVNNGNE